jgi:hypothetical protein
MATHSTWRASSSPSRGSNEPSPAFNGCALRALPCGRSERRLDCTPNTSAVYLAARADYATDPRPACRFVLLGVVLDVEQFWRSPHFHPERRSLAWAVRTPHHRRGDARSRSLECASERAPRARSFRGRPGTRARAGRRRRARCVSGSTRNLGRRWMQRPFAPTSPPVLLRQLRALDQLTCLPSTSRGWASMRGRERSSLRSGSAVYCATYTRRMRSVVFGPLR